MLQQFRPASGRTKFVFAPSGQILRIVDLLVRQRVESPFKVNEFSHLRLPVYCDGVRPVILFFSRHLLDGHGL